MNGWLETYRWMVYRWQEDHNGHMTVAFYFGHLGDATLLSEGDLRIGLDGSGVFAEFAGPDGPVRIVRLNRPEQLNATNAELHLALARLFPKLSADAEARAAVTVADSQ